MMEESSDDQVKKERLVQARARNISHNVRCTECGSQSIEDSQADIAIILRKVPALYHPSLSLSLLLQLLYIYYLKDYSFGGQ